MWRARRGGVSLRNERLPLFIAHLPRCHRIVALQAWSAQRDEPAVCRRGECSGALRGMRGERRREEERGRSEEVVGFSGASRLSELIMSRLNPSPLDAGQLGISREHEERADERRPRPHFLPSSLRPLDRLARSVSHHPPPCLHHEPLCRGEADRRSVGRRRREASTSQHQENDGSCACAVEVYRRVAGLCVPSRSRRDPSRRTRRGGQTARRRRGERGGAGRRARWRSRGAWAVTTPACSASPASPSKQQSSESKWSVAQQPSSSPPPPPPRCHRSHRYSIDCDSSSHASRLPLLDLLAISSRCSTSPCVAPPALADVGARETFPLLAPSPAPVLAPFKQLKQHPLPACSPAPATRGRHRLERLRFSRSFPPSRSRARSQLPLSLLSRHTRTTEGMSARSSEVDVEKDGTVKVEPGTVYGGKEAHDGAEMGAQGGVKRCVAASTLAQSSTIAQ